MTSDLHQAVEAALRGIIDPETGQDIVAMGLVYDIALQGDLACVTMTTTTPGCPMAELLRQGAEVAVAAVPGIATAEVRLTWEPRWTPDRMAPAA